jgi:hypothetical protein
MRWNRTGDSNEEAYHSEVLQGVEPVDSLRWESMMLLGRSEVLLWHPKVEHVVETAHHSEVLQELNMLMVSDAQRCLGLAVHDDEDDADAVKLFYTHNAIVNNDTKMYMLNNVVTMKRQMICDRDYKVLLIMMLIYWMMRTDTNTIQWWAYYVDTKMSKNH